MALDPYLPYVSRVPLAWEDTDEPSAHWLEGTLLFVDVAGFTALSERLSRSGRAGAEELTDLLDGAFARLLSAAYEDGGSLLSFGGDALLLFVHGPDHPRRAAHAAGVIRRKPAELGALSTSVGKVRLRLSMGAHSGRFVFFVAGGSSRSVLLLGADTTRTVRLEQRAQAGQVLLGASLAAAVPEAVGPLEDGAAFLLRTPQPPLVGDPEPVGPPRTDPARFLSPPLREHIAARQGSEHRRVAVGFLQVRGTDALLESDPELALSALDEIVRRTQDVSTELGVTLIGTDVDADGAKLILVAGAPRATEHEEERLLRACRAVLDLDVPFELRGGVCAGPVFVGDVGPGYRRAYTVMGDRVNLAARLMASAAPGELRTLPSILAKSATRFATTELEPLRLKGIREPVEAVAVGAPLTQVELEETSGLFGREQELAALRGALRSAETGTGSAWELVGSAGIGKSAVISALFAETTHPTLRVSAASYERETPYGVVKRALRHVLGVDAEAPSRDVGARAAAALGELSPADLALVLIAADGTIDGLSDPGRDDLFEVRLTRAVRRALQLLVPTTACLVIEDLQWADTSSTGLLRAMADSMSEHPWVLITTRRPDGPGLGRGSLLELAPLDDEAATELVHHLTLEAPVTPQRAADLVARSGGNPLFLTELVGLGDDELPESVEAVAHARLDALPGYLRRLVRQAAVLGTRFDLDLLAELAGFLPDHDEWRQLDGVLQRQGSRALFPSEMFREVAYGSLLYRDRRALHQTAGRALAARGQRDIEILALHAALARDDELSWAFGVEAGERAESRGAHDQAAVSLRRALQAHERSGLGPPAETLAARVLLGDCLVRAGRGLEALPEYARARRVAPRPDDPGLCHKEALARIELGRHAAARSWLKRGLEACGPEDREVMLGLLESTAGVQYRQGRYRAARRTCEQIVELTEGTSDRPSYAHAHMLLHAIYITTGDERRRWHRTQALEAYEELGDVRGQARALNNLGTDAFYESRWSEAVEYFERSRLCEAADANDIGAAISDSNIAEVLSDQGSFDEAHTRLTRALRTFRAGDFPLGVAEVLNNLGRLEARRSEWAAAESHLAEARRIVAEIGADMLLPDVTIRDAELAVLRGQVERAAAVLDACAALPESRTEIDLQAGQLRAVIAARRGDDAVAEELLRQVIAATPAGSFSGALARHSLAVLLHRAGRPEAETHRHAALDTLRRLGVHRFRDPLAGDDLVVIALPHAVVDLTQRQAEREAAAV